MRVMRRASPSAVQSFSGVEIMLEIGCQSEVQSAGMV